MTTINSLNPSTPTQVSASNPIESSLAQAVKNTSSKNATSAKGVELRKVPNLPGKTHGGYVTIQDVYNSLPTPKSGHNPVSLYNFGLLIMQNQPDHLFYKADNERGLGMHSFADDIGASVFMGPNGKGSIEGESGTQATTVFLKVGDEISVPSSLLHPVKAGPAR